MLIVLFVTGAGNLFAAAPYKGTSVGSPTTPPSSSYRSGTYRSTTTTPSGRYQSPAYTNPGTSTTTSSTFGDGRTYQQLPDYSYRLYSEGITNDVNGSRYYDSNVPYRSSSQVNVPLGYGSLNSFLRNSSQYIHSRGYSTQFAPYYLPSRNYRTYNQTTLSGSVPSQYASQSATQQYYNTPDGYYYDDLNPASRGRPLDSDLVNLELQMLRESGEINTDLNDVNFNFQDHEVRNMLLEKYMEQEDKFYRENTRSNQIESRLSTQNTEDDQTQSLDTDPIASNLSPSQPNAPGQPLLPGQRPDQFELYQPTTPEEDMHESEKEHDPLDPEDLLKQQEEFDLQRQAKPSGKSLLQNTDEQSDEQDDENQDQGYILNLTADHQTARVLMGSNKSYSEYADVKAADFIDTGDKYLKDGKFYKAADAYSLASIYAADNPRPFWGRGIALFAAGEYLTSSQYIERAIALSPEYAYRQMNIGFFIDSETLDMRLSNLNKWYETSGSPRFMLLASYIYYQRGDIAKAKESLDKAADQMTGRPAFEAMRKAISSSTGVPGK